MKRKKITWSLWFENLKRKPKEILDDWLIDKVRFAIDEELTKTIFLIDETNEMLDYFSTTTACYQVGMIVQMENKDRFLIERIEVSRKCTSWELHGKVIK